MAYRPTKAGIQKIEFYQRVSLKEQSAQTHRVREKAHLSSKVHSDTTQNTKNHFILHTRHRLQVHPYKILVHLQNWRIDCRTHAANVPFLLLSEISNRNQKTKVEEKMWIVILRYQAWLKLYYCIIPWKGPSTIGWLCDFKMINVPKVIWISWISSNLLPFIGFLNCGNKSHMEKVIIDDMKYTLSFF